MFIEDSADARAAIRRNVEALKLTGVTKIFRRDATSLGPAQTLQPFDLIFCDPPYGKGLGEKALQSAVEGGWVAEDAIVVLEERAGLEIQLPDPFEIIDQRDYGDTQIVIGKSRYRKIVPVAGPYAL